MYNSENNFTRLTLEQSDRKIVWEVPYEDVDGVEDMMQAIYTIMVGMTFAPQTVYSSMANFINEHAQDQFYVTEISEKENNED